MRDVRRASSEFRAYDLAGLAASIVVTDRPKKKGTGTKAGPLPILALYPLVTTGAAGGGAFPLP